MPKSVCSHCECELKPKKNGVIVVEMFHNNEKIYKLWSADLWKCPLCGIQVALGFPEKPFRQHFDGDCEDIILQEIANGKTIIYDKEVKG